MNLSTRYALIASLLFAIVFGAFIYNLQDEIKPRYREGLEATLVDTATLLSNIASRVPLSELSLGIADARESKLPATIYNIIKDKFSLRIYITDNRGVVVYHSEDQSQVGADYSRWRDVALTLKSQYGARSTKDNPDDANSGVLYVARPILRNGTLVGVLTVGQSQKGIYQFINRSQSQLWKAVIYSFLIFAFLQYVFSRIIANPVKKLILYTKLIAEGKNPVVPNISAGELKAVVSSVEMMRQSLEGKKYIEEYIQHLTHELKSPTSGIRGSAELLKEGVDPVQAERFIDNILHEVYRLDEIISRLLELASLEGASNLSLTTAFNVMELVRQSSAEFENVKISGDNNLEYDGDPFLIKKAIGNLIKNSREFSPPQSQIKVEFEKLNGVLNIRVIDDGSGIPEYALSRLGEKFFSMPRPDTGRKGTGLGLSFVIRIVELHAGNFSIRNKAPAGVVAEIQLSKR